jgi:uncharacterized membrane-anchored protein
MLVPGAVVWEFSACFGTNKYWPIGGNMTSRHLAFVTIAAAAFVFIAPALWAQGTSDTRTPEQVLKSLNYRHGHIDLHNGMASLDLPPGYAYLDPADSETFLTKIYGNPPSSTGPDTDGMVVPEGVDLQSTDGWAVVINYDSAGHVSDDDAASTDFSDLLKTMQKQTDEQNPDRKKAGYEEVQLIGWAEPPHYDSSAKIVYWAEQLKFGDSSTDTLNYKIRVLGREGVLQLNVVDSIGHLDRIRKLSPTLLTMASFSPGKTYADFKSGDHMAEYGIAGLIAGGVLLKTGLLKGLLVALAALWKPIAIGVAALGAGFARFFRRGPRIKPGA